MIITAFQRLVKPPMQRFTLAQTISLLIILANSAIAQAGAIGDGTSILSPDRRFSVSVTEKDHSESLIIKNEDTGQVYAPVGIPTILLALRWSGDSRTVGILLHLAGGSILRVIHFRDGRWTQSDIAPPISSYGHYSVVQLKMGFNGMTISYKIAHEDRRGVKVGFSLCTFNVNLETGTVSNLKSASLTADEYKQLRIIDP